MDKEIVTNSGHQWRLCRADSEDGIDGAGENTQVLQAGTSNQSAPRATRTSGRSRSTGQVMLITANNDSPRRSSLPAECSRHRCDNTVSRPKAARTT